MKKWINSWEMVAILLLTALCVVQSAPETVRGVVGCEVRITCTEMNSFSNYKYFCKDPCGNDQVLIHSGGLTVSSKGRYRIQDERNTFYVTISDLKKSDEGIYFCGIDRIGPDTYKEIHLKVEDALKTPPPSPARSSVLYVKAATTSEVMTSGTDETTRTMTRRDLYSSSDKLVYIGAGLGVTVLLLAVVLLVFIRQRKNRTNRTTAGKHHEIIYATPAKQQQEGPNAITTEPSTDDPQTGSQTTVTYSSSTNHLQDSSTNPTDNIYSNVKMSSESEMRLDYDVCSSPGKEGESIFYSIVSLSDDANHAPSRQTERVTYSTVKNTSTDFHEEATIYSNVQ